MSHVEPICPRRRNARRAPLSAAIVVALLAATVGCDAYRELPARYGRRSGNDYGDSVNGTAVFAEMFDRRGHTVSSWSSLSPRLEQADVIVWFPDDFSGPTAKQREWLERWLSESSQRTLIYVGRDFDAAPLYWNKVLAQQPPLTGQDATAAGILSAKAVADANSDRAAAPADMDFDWFRIVRKPNRRVVTSLDTSPWYDPDFDDVDPTKLEIELAGRLLPRDVDNETDLKWRREDLLVSSGDLLVCRLEHDDWDGSLNEDFLNFEYGQTDGFDDDVFHSQLILVQNGSFLLNLPLVNQQHRVLASMLIDETERYGGTKQNVVFLESDAGGPDIRDTDPDSNPPVGPAFEPPLSYLLGHGTLIAVLAVLAGWPIFGRPKQLPSRRPSDFSHHIRALGRRLAEARAYGFSMARIAQFQKTTRGEAPPDSPETTNPPTTPTEDNSQHE